MREGLGEFSMRSSSSIMLWRSSSVVMEMRESRSSFGSWYLREKGVIGLLLKRVLERWDVREERVVVVWWGREIKRVSPPA
jgi:hypothetical protein